MSRCANSAIASVSRHDQRTRRVDLAEKLLQIAPVPMSKVLFQCSGSEANDTAIKLVWYYHAAIGKPNKRKIIGRKMGYHGSTIAPRSASRASPTCTPISACRSPISGTPSSRTTTACMHDGESEEAVRHPHGRCAGGADHRGRPRHGRRLHRRAGDGRGRRA